MKKRLDKIVDLIVNSINKDIKEEEERFNFKFERKSMKDYLEEIRWGMTSEEFKEEVMYIATNYDNELYKKGYLVDKLYIQMMDDGSIINNDGKEYSYKQIMSLVRNKVFKKQ